MILQVIHDNKMYPIDTTVKETVDGSNGIDYIDFSISGYDEHYKVIACEDTIYCGEQKYVIKLIDCTDTNSINITAYIDHYDLTGTTFIYDNALKWDNKTLPEMMQNLYDHIALNDTLHRWNYKIIANDTSTRLSLDLTGGEYTYNAILNEMANLFGYKIRYDSISKIIRFINISDIKSKGLYIIDQLNLEKLDYTIASDNLYTRLYVFGAEKASAAAGAYKYVNIAEINNGKAYIENHSYTTKAIDHVEHFDNITDPQELLKKGKELINKYSSPIESFSITIADVARLDPNSYSLFGLEIYDKVKVIDNMRGKVVEEQIMKIERNLDRPEETTIEMSNEPISIINR